MLLVPGGGRQHDVGIDAGGGHAEIERHQQVELALARASSRQRTSLGLHAARLAQVLAEHAVFGAEQVFQEVFVPLARRAEQVGAPDEHVAREALRRRPGLRMREAEAAAGESLGDVARHGFPRGFRRRGDLQRVLRQLPGRRAASPAARRVTLQSISVPSQRGRIGAVGESDLRRGQLLVAPLVGVLRRRSEVAFMCRGGRCQSSAKASGGPAGLRPQLFLAHIVRPAAARLADAAAHHQQVDDAAIDHVHVVPMVDARRPRITIDLPLVFSALAANSRATAMICARGTPGDRLGPGRACRALSSS